MLRVLSLALTRPPVAGSHPSPSPARRSFLHAPSTPHGTSCNSPEEGNTNKHLCYWSESKCRVERETPGLHFIHPVGKKKGKVSVARSPVCAYGRSQCSLHCFRGAYCFLVLHNLLALWAWPFWPKRILIAGVVKAFDIWVPWYGTHSSFSASLWDFQPFWLHTRWKW